MAEATSGTTPASPSLFEHLLGANAVQSPTEERSTVELDKVGDLVTRGAYDEAGRAAAQLLRAGVCDVRLVGPLLLGDFLERGFTSLPTLFASVQELLTQRWSAFGPGTKKELLADSGLRWLFKTLSKHLESHERLKDAIWQDWCAPRHREPAFQTLALSEPLLVALASTLPKGACVPPLRHLISWLQAFGQALAPELPAPESEPKPAPQPVEAATASLDSRASQEEPPAPAPQPEPTIASREFLPTLPISPAMELLMRKLHGFTSLLEREEYLKASIVASDVLAILECFDPCIYLPALLSPFFTRLSTNAQELESLMQDTESLSLRALHQLYQVDLDAFLAPGLTVGQPSEE